MCVKADFRKEATQSVSGYNKPSTLTAGTEAAADGTSVLVKKYITAYVENM